MFNYLYRYELIKNNPVVLVDMPKLHEKAIIRLEPDETARLLDFIEHGGDELTGQKKVWPVSGIQHSAGNVVRRVPGGIH